MTSNTLHKGDKQNKNVKWKWNHANISILNISTIIRTRFSIIPAWRCFLQMIFRFFANTSILFNILLWNLGRIGEYKVDCLLNKLSPSRVKN
jgi:hypothetical protein